MVTERMKRSQYLNSARQQLEEYRKSLTVPPLLACLVMILEHLEMELQSSYAQYPGPAEKPLQLHGVNLDGFLGYIQQAITAYSKSTQSTPPGWEATLLGSSTLRLTFEFRMGSGSNQDGVPGPAGQTETRKGVWQQGKHLISG